MLITIPLRTPSQNLWHRRQGLRSYQPIKAQWFTLLRSRLTPKAQETRPMNLTINTYRARLLDTGNLWGGTKPIPDALIMLGYLKDDAPAWCKFHVEQFQVAKRDEHTDIILTVRADHPTVHGEPLVARRGLQC